MTKNSTILLWWIILRILTQILELIYDEKVARSMHLFFLDKRIRTRKHWTNCYNKLVYHNTLSYWTANSYFSQNEQFVFCCSSMFVSKVQSLINFLNSPKACLRKLYECWYLRDLPSQSPMTLSHQIQLSILWLIKHKPDKLNSEASFNPKSGQIS